MNLLEWFSRLHLIFLAFGVLSITLTGGMTYGLSRLLNKLEEENE